MRDLRHQFPNCISNLRCKTVVSNVAAGQHYHSAILGSSRCSRGLHTAGHALSLNNDSIFLYSITVLWPTYAYMLCSMPASWFRSARVVDYLS